METKLQSEIKNVLKQFPEYWEDDSLLKNKVIDDLRNYKKDLIEKLLSNETIRNTYSLKLENGTIFKIEDFISMLRYKKYWENSYTRYSNEIGLTSDDKYLKYNTDVVIDFPHKDCVLEGGMTKEEVRKDEVYYHKVLAKEEIDIMFSPKVLTNITKYDENGERQITEFVDTENLILKGNNLIALHTLKERFAGKVKLIYIDPPYNTGNDSFRYNDKFNHSTWLTFMKNRLEIAKELLKEDGSIWINIDDDESHYLKVLADEIFGRNNFLANIIWQKKYSPQNDAKYFSDMHDHILVFAKDKAIWKANPMPRTKEMNARYTNRDNDPRGPWKAENFSVKTYSSDYDYEITTPSGRVVRPPNGRSWSTSKENFLKLVEDNRVWFGSNGNNVPAIKKFLSEVKDGMSPITTWSGEDFFNNDQIPDFWHYEEVSHTQDAKRELIGLKIDFSTPKPEKLLQRIINIGSDEGDLVLDFFMGSATTAAVAMKMDRQFIGIEQMDYIETVSVPRLRKVIEGEQGGISKAVNWTGGGSFVYAELYQLNQKYVDLIQKANSDEEIENLIGRIKESAYLDFKISFDKVTNNNSDFASLSLNEKKDILIQALDANQMYLGYSEMDDEQYDIPEQVKQFNHSFYNKKKDVKHYE
ncbi:site-specific DNA-methyltransferase [Caldifermentibacillus hisashii]|uniref:site-specific DNA-methyltransferase n=1 Tax=Caldifermentibacillus hisashii TaxID=996558 RepID=UPI0030D65CD2